MKNIRQECVFVDVLILGDNSPMFTKKAPGFLAQILAPVSIRTFLIVTHDTTSPLRMQIFRLEQLQAVTYNVVISCYLFA